VITFESTTDGVLDMVKETIASSQDRVRLVASAVGAETVAFLRSLTSEMRPPARSGGQLRPAHPGHWADVTGDLARAYAWELQLDGETIVLALMNSMAYAATLEARDGYFVLSGVADPGGPVEEALRRAVEKVAPDWRVVHD
jgi:hypothetical protein